MTRELLFSVTAADCDFKASRGSGKGGQKRNTTASKIRCVHRASGAAAESDQCRDQHRNKRDAFVKMAQTDTFKTWHRLEVARVTGEQAKIEAVVDATTVDANIRVEVRVDGLWVEVV